MSQVLILGGHGKIALLLAPLLRAAGNDVTSVIRNPEHADDVRQAGATPLVADIEGQDVSALTDVVSGYDAVVFSAGAGGGSAERTYAVDRDAAIRSMHACEQAGVQRYVMVSWMGSRADHGVPQDNSFFAYADAKYAADAALRKSSLDYTILGPGTLTQEPPTGRVTRDPQGRGEVARADVAAVIAAVLEDDATVGKTIRFGAGQTPIAEALIME